MTRYNTEKKCKKCGSKLKYSYVFSTYLCPKCNELYDFKDLEDD